MNPRLYPCLLLVYIQFIASAHGQQPESLPLKIGSTCPNVKLNNILNYSPDGVASLHDFSGELLLIDFWNTRCGVCISSFPKLEKLQEKFAGKLKILLVTYESDTIIQRFFAKRQKAKHIVTTLPVVTGDTTLKHLFKHTFEPHYVWVDKQNVVRFITGVEEISESNIAAFFEGKNLSLKHKTDEGLPYTFYRPLFVYGNGGNADQLMYHSVLSGYIEGLPSIVGILADTAKSYFTIKVFNADIRHLYQIAYNDVNSEGSGMFGIPSNRTMLQVKDTSDIVSTLEGVWHGSRTYCYELIVPRHSKGEMKRIMQEDLKRYFNLDVTIKKKKMKCLVLRCEDLSVVSSKGGKNTETNYINALGVDMVNVPFKNLLIKLKHEYLKDLPYPFLDETGITGNIDMKIDADMYDWKVLSQALEKYGMDLSLREREVEILILSEKQIPIE